MKKNTHGNLNNIIIYFDNVNFDNVNFDNVDNNNCLVEIFPIFLSTYLNLFQAIIKINFDKIILHLF